MSQQAQQKTCTRLSKNRSTPQTSWHKNKSLQDDGYNTKLKLCIKCYTVCVHDRNDIPLLSNVVPGLQIKSMNTLWHDQSDSHVKSSECTVYIFLHQLESLQKISFINFKKVLITWTLNSMLRTVLI